jgi:DNA-binding NarL/FixJ family response regulator
MSKINIVLADDHVLVRNGIKAMLEADKDLDVIGEAGTGAEALAVSQNLNPDLLILDVRMPEMNGLEAAAKLGGVSPNTKAIILSMHDSEEYVIQALKAGAYGYILKDIDKTEFVKALKQVHSGLKYFSGSVSNVLASRLLDSKPLSANLSTHDESTYHLTRKEKEILRMVVAGGHNKEIAESTGKSIRTIETHRFNIMKKMGVNNAVDVVNKAVRENLI